MKLFSSLGLNITFLQEFFRSTGSSQFPDLVTGLTLPRLLSFSFSLSALSGCIISLLILYVSLVIGEVYCVVSGFKAFLNLCAISGNYRYVVCFQIQYCIS